jgi:osmotically-inducible protein OsmY
MNTLHLKTTARLLGGTVVLTLLGACASTRTQEGTGEYLDDTVITTKVKAAILGEPTLKAAEINVETFKGRVQLSGFVSSRPQMDTAVAVARNVKGVSGVTNDMRVK